MKDLFVNRKDDNAGRSCGRLANFTKINTRQITKLNVSIH